MKVEVIEKESRTELGLPALFKTKSDNDNRVFWAMNYHRFSLNDPPILQGYFLENGEYAEYALNNLEKLKNKVTLENG